MSDLVSTDISVCGFNGGSSACVGLIPINLQVGTRSKETVFFVIDITTTFNALLGRDWLHKVGAIPSTLHQELILWHNDHMEVIVGDHTIGKQANTQTMSVYAEKRVPLPKDLTLPQRYKLGDPTVGPLGQPSGKFNYLVSYDTPRHKYEDIKPTGWEQDVEPLPAKEEEVKDKEEVAEALKAAGPENLSPLEVDMAQAGILPLLNQHCEGTEWEPKDSSKTRRND